MNLRRVLSRYKKPSREGSWVGGRMANGEWRMGGLRRRETKQQRQISICRLRGCGGHGAVQTGEMVASAPIMRVRARNPNKKMASLAMKSPTQSVRYRVRRAGATPSGRARSIGRGWEDCQGSGCFSTDPAKAYKYGSDEKRTFCQRRASALARRCRHRISPVGAGLLAKALSRLTSTSLTDRVRQQAGSYRRGAEHRIGR